MEQCIPYSLICDLFRRNLETHFHINRIVSKGESRSPKLPANMPSLCNTLEFSSETCSEYVELGVCTVDC